VRQEDTALGRIFRRGLVDRAFVLSCSSANGASGVHPPRPRAILVAALRNRSPRWRSFRDSRDHHATDAKCRDRHSAVFTGPSGIPGVPAKKPDHSFKDVLERRLDPFITSSYIARQSNHGTGVFNIFQVLARQVGADLRTGIGRAGVYSMCDSS
jgi:hypothetical protein